MSKRSHVPDPLIVERDNRIIDAAKSGMRPTDICAYVDGATMAIVNRVLSTARKAGQPIPYHPRGSKLAAIKNRRVGVNLTQGRMQKLVKFAGTRAETPAECASLLLSTIIEDDMFDAVLDDGDDQ